MKNLIFAALFFAGLLNFSAQAQPMNNSNFQDEYPAIESGQNDPSAMFLENQSKYDFSETIEKLKTAIEKKTWKLTATHDLQQTLKTYGKDVLSGSSFVASLVAKGSKDISVCFNLSSSSLVYPYNRIAASFTSKMEPVSLSIRKIESFSALKT